eukprot:GHRQ01007691.1.p3 GENE.GHRQ01007691.1~~GHRQ01007691.1.p3  ORF type:complete len:113 (-),score=16.25 GHRQ01007691.1:434-772(-)
MHIPQAPQAQHITSGQTSLLPFMPLTPRSIKAAHAAAAAFRGFCPAASSPGTLQTQQQPEQLMQLTPPCIENGPYMLPWLASPASLPSMYSSVVLAQATYNIIYLELQLICK